MRILALDYGSKTVGLAITDPLGLIVQPLRTIWREREGKLRKTVEEIVELCKEYQVEELVLGYPYHMDGSEGERVERVLAFQEMLKKKIELPIHLYDERLSTMEAEEILWENGVPKAKQKEVLDQVAAQVILEDFLRNREGNNKENP